MSDTGAPAETGHGEVWEGPILDGPLGGKTITISGTAFMYCMADGVTAYQYERTDGGFVCTASGEAGDLDALSADDGDMRLVAEGALDDGS